LLMVTVPDDEPDEASAPGLIVPALITAPVTVDDAMMIEVVTCPAAFVTLATVLPVTLCPASTGLARRSAATEVVAKRTGTEPSAGLKAKAGIDPRTRAGREARESFVMKNPDPVARTL
jgi:hypothetical protein